MQENVALIKEINELRREVKIQKMSAMRAGTRSPAPEKADDTGREIDMQRDLISRLRTELENKEDRIAELEACVLPRPMSRERLPPMDGFAAAPDAISSR